MGDDGCQGDIARGNRRDACVIVALVPQCHGAALTSGPGVAYTHFMTQTAATKEPNLKTYIFPVELEQEEDGRWSAVVQSLPGCATWGYSKQEALKALQEATQAYIQTLLEQGKQVPTSVDIEVKETPAVSVTV